MMSTQSAFFTHQHFQFRQLGEMKKYSYGKLHICMPPYLISSLGSPLAHPERALNSNSRKLQKRPWFHPNPAFVHFFAGCPALGDTCGRGRAFVQGLMHLLPAVALAPLQSM